MTATPLTDATVETALRIIADASKTARRYFRQEIPLEFKSDQSPVTLADKTIESEIRSALLSAFPGVAILGEEHGFKQAKETQASDMWIVDPIDGTRSFISGHPLFGMLLGLTRNSAPILGIVAMPALNEIFVGGPELGARLNGAEICVSECTGLDSATLFVNEAEKILAADETALRNLVAAPQTMRFGYDCYPHALLALGQVDCVVDYDLKPYDYLPVVALVQGAGGLMTDWQGNALTTQSDGRTISAATPQLHEQLIHLLARASP